MPSTLGQCWLLPWWNGFTGLDGCSAVLAQRCLLWQKLPQEADYGGKESLGENDS